MGSESHGLATLEPLTARVGLWRRRHRSRADSVRTYQVVYDGACIADFAARTTEALDDELASAAWELAQSIGRPVTAELVALDAEGAELARLPLRVLPAPSSTRGEMDSAAIVGTLTTANNQLMKLVVDVLQSVTEQQKTIAGIATELARVAGKRAATAEQEAAEATSTALDAVATAREASQKREKRTNDERAADLIEAFLRSRFILGGAPGEGPPSGEHPAASGEE